MLLKDIFLLKTVHNVMKLNSKNYDEQLNLTRSSIKNKLFEITKEFKFLQNLRMEFTKNNELF